MDDQRKRKQYITLAVTTVCAIAAGIWAWRSSTGNNGPSQDDLAAEQRLAEMRAASEKEEAASQPVVTTSVPHPISSADKPVSARKGTPPAKAPE